MNLNKMSRYYCIKKEEQTFIVTISSDMKKIAEV